MFEIIELQRGRGALARRILCGLPDWFGIPESVDAYVAACEHLPMLAVRAGDELIGFLSLKEHTPVATEAYVLGVERGWHRRGCGRALFAAAERRLVAKGVRYLTVKTFAASHPDPFYAATRAFYEVIGFEPIEEFPTLWNEENPCLMMLKRIEPLRPRIGVIKVDADIPPSDPETDALVVDLLLGLRDEET